ncbi:MAG: hypothetical protein WCA59_01075 [Candidatus Binataceae bacterium]
MVRARAGKGLGFSESPRSVLGEIHLNYGEVCGLYNEDGPEPEEMLAGFVIHNLAMFPQSYPRPDLTHLSPEHVYECGELWALAPGAARLARHAGYILAGLRKAKAILVYVALKPRDTTSLYKTFARAGEPIPWHYITSLDGTPHWAQPMVLEGLALEMTVNVATAVSFESFDDQTLQFRNPFPIVPKINRRIPLRLPSVQEVRGSRVVQFRR